MWMLVGSTVQKQVHSYRVQRCTYARTLGSGMIKLVLAG